MAASDGAAFPNAPISRKAKTSLRIIRGLPFNKDTTHQFLPVSAFTAHRLGRSSGYGRRLTGPRYKGRKKPARYFLEGGKRDLVVGSICRKQACENANLMYLNRI